MLNQLLGTARRFRTHIGVVTSGDQVGHKGVVTLFIGGTDRLHLTIFTPTNQRNFKAITIIGFHHRH
ncbi:Uncharacterised protein [Vibrio cholerae]|nr:Uncharacterised protein [Vibrio cholerae]